MNVKHVFRKRWGFQNLFLLKFPVSCRLVPWSRQDGKDCVSFMQHISPLGTQISGKGLGSCSETHSPSFCEKGFVPIIPANLIGYMMLYNKDGIYIAFYRFL